MTVRLRTCGVNSTCAPAGTTSSATSTEASQRERLGERERPEELALRADHQEDGQEADHHGRDRRHHRAGHLAGGPEDHVPPVRPRRRLLQAPQDVLADDDAHVHDYSLYIPKADVTHHGGSGRPRWACTLCLSGLKAQFQEVLLDFGAISRPGVFHFFDFRVVAAKVLIVRRPSFQFLHRFMFELFSSCKEQGALGFSESFWPSFFLFFVAFEPELEISGAAVEADVFCNS